MTLFMCCCCFVFCSTVSAQDWPIHRGDAALTGSTTGTINAPLKLLWRKKVSTTSGSSLVGKNNQAFVATPKGEVICLNPKDGNEIWKIKVEREQFTGAPTLFDNALCVGSEKGRLVVLSQVDGSELWQFKAKGKFIGSANTYKRKDGILSLIVVSWDNHVYSLNAKDGSVLWKFASEDRLNATPGIHKNNVVFGGCDGFVRVLDADTGLELASVDAGSYIAAPISMEWPRVYVGHHEAKFLCLEPFAEKVHWSFSKREDPYVAAPAIQKDFIVFGCDDQRVHCLNKQGKQLWEFKTQAKVMGGALIVSDKVFIGSDDGFVYLLNLSDGKELWKYEIGAEVDCDPAFINGTVLVSAHDGHVYAFGTAKP